MALPRTVLVKQHLTDRRIGDIPAEVQKQLSGSGLGANLAPGSRIAVGVGSRGISNIATIVRAVVDYWKSRGMQPFIFPAMGSHGAATAEGQADVLAHYGIHEATMGVPVVSDLGVVSVGKTDDGIEAFMDQNAFESDGVMLIGRVKWHTDFAGKIESGLYKMMAIGLGKFAGAQNYHTHAYKKGLDHVIRAVGRQVLSSGKILGGLAILEDAHHNTGLLEVVPVANMEAREEELLALAKSWMSHVPFDLDILILDEIGKNISGAGMDTKVVNRSVQGGYNPWPNTPHFQRVFVRDVSDNTYGNAVGLGLADVINSRMLPKIDWKPTRINSLTASTPAAIKVPVNFASDTECIESMMPTVGKHDLSEVTVGRIRNTLELGLVELSENLLPLIAGRADLELLTAPAPMDLDAEGNFRSKLSVAHQESGEALAKH